MFTKPGSKSRSGSDAKRLFDALGQSVALIEFDPTGSILWANANFCDAMGYSLAEIVGKHHRMFVDPAYAASGDYRAFWERLGRGEFDAREYRRVGKGGKEVWIQASYNPVKTNGGKVLKIVKAATDITREKLRNAEFEGKLNAISRVQAVIEFTVTGEIIDANQNFLDTLGYRLDEIKGRHHRMFVEPAQAQSAEYQDFWRKLAAGEFISAEFKRFGKDGKRVWIQASYNPIFDMNKKVFKVVKFATDITDRVNAVDQIANALSRLADNDLEHRIVDPFTPTFETLRGDFNRSVENLRAAMAEITNSISGIQSGAREISSASDDLARRTEQQAASLEETSAALAEITSTVKKAADSAGHARQVVSYADGDAKKSTVVVRETVVAMDAIAKSSQEIGQIIGVIDEIAFQTNLLALNAGVEAARAGEAGRGFAVVASEVRALAQRSAEAAKEIKGLISTSTTQVKQGVDLVAQTGQSLDRIMAQVSEINDIVSEIASGAREQATGLEQVHIAITQMDEVTQRNAAMVEETTAASHTLSAETTQLSSMIGQFRIGRAGDDGAMRRELKRTAPHAFREPTKVAPTGAPRSKRAAPVARVVNGGAGAATAEQWEEF